MTEPFQSQLTDAGWRVLTCAREEAVRLRAEAVDTDHLLSALARCGESVVDRAFGAIGVSGDEMGKHVAAQSRPAAGPVPRPLPMSASSAAAMEGAVLAGRLMSADRVDAEHILLGVLRAGGAAGAALHLAGVPLADARSRALEALGVPTEVRQELEVPRAPRDGELSKVIEEVRADLDSRAGRGDPGLLPALELTAAARPIHLLGRDRELAKLEEILQRGERTSLFVIGPSGSGKRALVRALAGRLAEKAGTGTPRRDVFLFEPELARAAAPPVFMGEGVVVGRWLADLLARGENSLFAFSRFISDEWVYDDFVEFVVPACIRRWIVCLFLVTPEERRELARRHPALNGLCLDLELPELSREHARAIVRRFVKDWPQPDPITVAETAADAAVHLAARFLRSRGLPGIAMEVLDRTRRRVQREFAPHLPDFERSIDALQQRIRESAERGDFDGAANLRRERNDLLRDYDTRLARLQEGRAQVVIGTGEIVKTVAELAGLKEEDVRSGGVWE